MISPLKRRGSKPSDSSINGEKGTGRLEGPNGDDLERGKQVSAGDDLHISLNLLIDKIRDITDLVAIKLELQNPAVITSVNLGVLDPLVFTLVEFEQ